MFCLQLNLNLKGQFVKMEVGRMLFHLAAETREIC